MKNLLLLPGIITLLLLCSCDPSHPGCCDTHNAKLNYPFNIQSTYSVSECGIIICEQTSLEQEIIDEIYDHPTLMDVDVDIGDLVD